MKAAVYHEYGSPYNIRIKESFVSPECLRIMLAA